MNIAVVCNPLQHAFIGRACRAIRSAHLTGGGDTYHVDSDTDIAVVRKPAAEMRYLRGARCAIHLAAHRVAGGGNL